MSKPNLYVLGARPEIDLYPKDLQNNFFVPSESRLSVEEPDGTIVTVSGADFTVASGYLWTLYKPTQKGWHQYEAWVKDGMGREAAATGGFDVIDKVY